MARNFVESSSQYIDFPKIDTLVGTVYTFAQRFKIASLGAAQLGLANHRDTVSSTIALFQNSILTTGEYRIIVQANGTDFVVLDSTTNPSTGVWHSGIGTRNVDDIELFLDGVSEATGTSPGAMGTITSDDFKVGAIDSGSGPLFFFDGDIADVAVWSVVLTQDEIDAYNKGVSPTLIRPDKLVSYLPLWGTTQEPDLGGLGGIGTLVNTPVVSTTNPAVMSYVKGKAHLNQASLIKKKEIDHFYAEQLAEVTQNSSTFLKVLEIPASFFVPNAKYLIISQTQLGCSGTTTVNNVRLSFNGAPVLGNEANLRFRSTISERRRLYYDIRVVTADVVPTAFEFEINNQTADTVRASNTTIFAMRLDKHFIEGVDYHYGEGLAAEYAEPLTSAQIAQYGSLSNLGAVTRGIILEDPEDFLVIGGARYFIQSNLQRMFITLRSKKDLSSAGAGGGVVLQVASTGDGVFYQSRFSADADTLYNFGVTAGHGSTGQKGWTEFKSIFLFKISSLADVVINEFPGGTVAFGAADTFIEMLSGSFTPNIGGAYVSLFHVGAVFSSNSAVGNKRITQRFRLNGVTVPLGYETNQLSDVQGSDDSPGFASLSYFGNIPKTLQTWIHEAKNAVTDTGGTYNTRSILMFSLMPKRRFSIKGVVFEEGTPVARTVRSYLSSTGEFLGETVSNATTGAYEICDMPGGDIFVVAFDDAGGESFNAEIFDKVVPVE